MIDLEGGLDTCIPNISNHCLYIYFPIDDDNEQLPNMVKLRAIARLGATLIAEGHRVLSHCGMGFNRSAFVAGLIMIEMGMPGPEVVARLRERRPGALFNDGFAACLEALLLRLAPDLNRCPRRAARVFLARPRMRRISSLLCCAAFCSLPAHAATLPSGFSETLVATGLSSPTTMQFAPGWALVRF